METEDAPPTFANLLYVEGSKDALTVNFFYMAPTKISRILASPNPEQFGQRLDGILRVPSEPVARVALSMNTAAHLMIELYRAITFSAPGLRDERLSQARRAVADIDEAVGWGRPTGGQGPAEGEQGGAG
ncbi:MAG TPA: hypothetical protein VFS43_30315 [Polyangiaceae bacterium]|nr:hypothetical protein [Polyangiaceae bacterium]